MNKRYKYSRYAMYTNIENSLKSLDLEVGSCLIIGDSFSGGEGSFLQKSDESDDLVKNPAILNMLPEGCVCKAPPYPDVDIHDLPYENDVFDYFLADQVLKHVRKPWEAMKQVYRVLKPGGLLILTSVMYFKMHGPRELDFWRFTPEGLKVLCEDFSKIIISDGSGNVKYITNILNNYGATEIVVGSKEEKEVLNNDKRNYVNVWIIARK